MIQPSEPSPSRAAAPVLYEIGASGALPSFDPLVTVKHRVLTKHQIRVYNHAICAIGCVLFPMYLVGFALRFVVVFAPVETGRVLGPITLGLQFPIVVHVVLALRFEFAKVLIDTFEFWFLLLTATIWVVCFALYLQDTRALVIPMCWIDFLDLLLIETYFQDTGNVTVAATLSACFLLVLSVGISLDAIPDGQHLALARMSAHILSTKDILVNTMATMIMMLMRLSYRKYEVLRSREHAPESGLWIQSTGYRCRIELRRVGAPTPVQVLTAPPASEESASDVKLLHMQLVQIPILFDAANTIHPGVTRFVASMHKGQLVLLYCAGLISFVATPIGLFPNTSNAYPTAASALAITSLCATLLFWLPILCCSQRQLVYKLCTSFDFLFVYMQLLSAHAVLCDMLSWGWCHCCCVLSSFVWVQGMLVMDTTTPVARAHLRWKPWFITAVLVSIITMQALLTLEAVNGSFSNRLIFDKAVSSSHRVQFYAVPFFFSRQFTLFVWYVRLLNRIRTRTSENELVLLLGNVEYNYEHWRQRLRQQSEAAVVPFSSRMRSFGHRIVSNFTIGRHEDSSADLAIVPVASGSEGRMPGGL